MPSSVLPRLSTPRDLSRPTDGAAGAFIAHLHGRPWLPWQRDAADLIGERLPTGRYAYPIVVVLVPRQTGKTTWAFDLAQGRCLDQKDYRAAYTAQTGHVTTERFGERMGELTSTALGRRVSVRKSQGTERMAFPHGSYLKAFPPKDGALRGSALDLVIVDEPQEILEGLGILLDQTILPTFTTRPRRQLILCGTAGTDHSKYLARYLAMARAGAAGVAVIEYGAVEGDDVTPGDDYTDPATWRKRHPGLAGGLTDEDALTSAMAVMGPDGFAREYMNVWQAAGGRTISAAEWTAIRHRDAIPADGVVPTLGVDVAMDRSATAVVASWPSTEGLSMVEVVEYRPGVAWAADRIRELHVAHRAHLWIDGGTGPAATVVADLGEHDWIHRATTREMTAASAGMLDAITGRTVGHRAERALDSAVAGAVRQTVSDGWVWGRRNSTTDVAPLRAGSLALYGLAHRPAGAKPRAVAAA